MFSLNRSDDPAHEPDVVTSKVVVLIQSGWPVPSLVMVEENPTVPATERPRHGVEEAKPVFTLKLSMSPAVPNVRIFAPCP